MTRAHYAVWRVVVMSHLPGMGLRVRVTAMLHIPEPGVVPDEKLWLHVFDVLFVLARPLKKEQNRESGKVSSLGINPSRVRAG